MSTFTRLAAIRRHLRGPAKQLRARDAKRVQKNLSILESDAARLKALALRDGVSQARLLARALDAYERQKPHK
jgi:hypothetical protein